MVNNGNKWKGIPNMGGNFEVSAEVKEARADGKIEVIKIGGEVVEDDQSIRHMVRQVIDLADAGANVVVAHGGGVQITKALEAAGVESKFVNGLRDTSEAAVGITQQCLQSLNDKIMRIYAEEASAKGVDVPARGLGGFEEGIITAVPVFENTRTGDVKIVDAVKLHAALEKTPVLFVYPICRGEDGGFMNVNADTVAADLAIALDADRLIICSNIPGVMDKNKNVISKIETNQIQSLIDDETVSGGMIPKLQSAAEVVTNSRVGGVVILNGKDPSAIERELFTEEGGGTLIVKSTDIVPAQKPALAHSL